MPPKAWSEAVIQRRTDNAMAKRKKTKKGQQWSTKYWKVIHESY